MNPFLSWLAEWWSWATWVLAAPAPVWRCEVCGQPFGCDDARCTGGHWCRVCQWYTRAR